MGVGRKERLDKNREPELHAVRRCNRNAASRRPMVFIAWRYEFLALFFRRSERCAASDTSTIHRTAASTSRSHDFEMSETIRKWRIERTALLKERVRNLPERTHEIIGLAAERTNSDTDP